MARKPKEDTEKLSQEVQQDVPDFVKEAFKLFPDYKELYLTPRGIYTDPQGEAKLYKNPLINE